MYTQEKCSQPKRKEMWNIIKLPITSFLCLCYLWEIPLLKNAEFYSHSRFITFPFGTIHKFTFVFPIEGQTRSKINVTASSGRI